MEQLDGSMDVCMNVHNNQDAVKLITRGGGLSKGFNYHRVIPQNTCR